MKVSLWPYGLVGDAPLEKLRELAKVDFSLCGMWRPSTEEESKYVKLLEEAVKSECKPLI